MDDHLLVEGLRARAPDATAEVYDAYADRLYAYCWFQVRDRDAAQVALRDTFVVAEAHIDRLRDPDRFGPWLYAVARRECSRRLPTRVRPPDLPVAQHDQDDVDQRIMAWQAVLALPPQAREVLELRVRHQLSVPDLAAVFDVPPKEAQALLERAHEELEGALTAEILAHQGPFGCAERALLLRVRRGEPAERRGERLLSHAQDCEVCGAFRPRTVSAAKVYGLLPDVEPPVGLRLRVMDCFLDAEFVGYRLFVATRAGDFAQNGFPVQSRQAADAPDRSRPRGGFLWPNRLRRTRSASAESPLGAHTRRVTVVLGVVTVLFGGVIASVHGLFGLLDWGPGRADIAAGPRPTAGPGRLPARAEDSATQAGTGQDGTIDAAPVSATFPLGSRGSSAPPIALPSPPSDAVHTADSESGAHSPLLPGETSRLEVAPLFLDLAGGSDGSIVLRAEGGPLTWRARSWGGVRPTPLSGRLRAGQTVTVDVHVVRDAAAQGEGGVRFQPGGTPVRVTWRPDDPGPGPSPSPTPTSTSPGPGEPSVPPKTKGPGGPASPPGSRPPSSAKPPTSGPVPSSGPPSSGGDSDPPPSPASPPASPSAGTTASRTNR